MITARIRIEDGAIEDAYKKWGFIYISGDRRFAPPEKKRDTTSYAEEAGHHTDSRTVNDAFEYKVRFLIEAPNKDLVNVNNKIKAWNDAVREKIAKSDVKRCKTVTLYDDYKRCKITGIPEIITEVDEKDYYRRHDGSVMDCVVIELSISVSNPNFCRFDTTHDPHLNNPNVDIDISLTTDGTDLYVSMSRPLAPDEHIRLLSRGRGRTNITTRQEKHKERSQFRWHVDSYNKSYALEITPEGKIEFNEHRKIGHEWDLKIMADSGKVVALCNKANASAFILPALKGVQGKVCFGVAIYNTWTRKSNVVYFRRNMEVLRDVGDDLDKSALRQWISV